MRNTNSLLFLLLLVNTLFAQNVKRTALPSWVKEVSFDHEKSTNQEGAFRYLLIDFQDNLIRKEQYIHYAIRVLNGDGIQEMSDISASYDPSYQTMEFHIANILRDGQTINKLINSQINTYHRETNLERSLYDGSLTSVINLSDVREGDIIEYAYTIKGFNPVNKGNYSSLFYQQYSLPVNRIYTRIVDGPKSSIKYKLIEGASKPDISNSNLGKEYIWDIDATKNFVYDNNVPYWYNKQKRVSVSTFANWNEVVDLMQPLYDISNPNLTVPIPIDKELDSKEDIIIKLIRFVQDDVRYLGFESGINAFKPNNPQAVLSRRYGDCKDKSLLLSTLLQNQGVTSYPILVNSKDNKDIDKLLPTHQLFNHCIVYFKHQDEEYFVDPTISNQGGDLDHFTTPNYNYGLILKKGTNSLTSIPQPKKARLRIVEDIVVDSLDRGATFSVKSEYYGSKADYMRSYFKNNTEESINKEYLDYYSNLYPTITSIEKITYQDDSRSWENIFTTNESYSIESLWSPLESDEGIYFETYALVLESLTNYSKSAKREMPYYLGQPFDFEQTTRIALPELWNVAHENPVINEPSFSYEKQISSVGKIVSVSHKYELKEEVINGDKVANFLLKQEQLRNHLGYQLSYNNNLSTVNKISWLSIMISLFAIILGVFLTLKLYREYNPKTEIYSEGMSIGGWLVLPAFGLVFTPFIILFQVLSAEYFHTDIWKSFGNAGYENFVVLNLYLGFELFYNLVFAIFSILLIVLFFKKRTSLPKLMVYFYAINLGMVLIGSFVLNQSGIEDPTFFQDVFKALIAAIIWIPYFLTSERVKNTFVNLYTGEKEVTFIPEDLKTKSY